MTLALSGKSRRRQGGLLVAALFAIIGGIVLAMYAGQGLNGTTKQAEAVTKANFLLIDEGTINNIGEGSVYDICGGLEDQCVNDHVAGLNQRNELFTVPNKIRPQSGLVWPAVDNLNDPDSD